jgi:hypothetical protein
LNSPHDCISTSIAVAAKLPIPMMLLKVETTHTHAHTQKPKILSRSALTLLPLPRMWEKNYEKILIREASIRQCGLEVLVLILLENFKTFFWLASSSLAHQFFQNSRLGAKLAFSIQF